MAVLQSDMLANLAFPSPAVAKMMRRWNYREGSGLGAHGQGIIVPIQFTEPCPKAGIGHCEKPYDNGLYVPSLPHVEEEWHKWKGLSQALRLEVECYEKITPPKQTDSSFRTLMLWAPLVHAEDMVLILETELWAPLVQAAKPSFGEATAWCTGWKKLFTPELRANERVLAHLEAGVDIVDSLVDYTW